MVDTAAAHLLGARLHSPTGRPTPDGERKTKADGLQIPIQLQIDGLKGNDGMALLEKGGGLGRLERTTGVALNSRMAVRGQSGEMSDGVVLLEKTPGVRPLVARGISGQDFNMALVWSLQEG